VAPAGSRPSITLRTLQPSAFHTFVPAPFQPQVGARDVEDEQGADRRAGQLPGAMAADAVEEEDRGAAEMGGAEVVAGKAVAS
jgi:hypothetical protein